MHKMISAVGTVLLLAGSAAANAATFHFTYIFTSGNVLAGTLQGTLGMDNNTITVTSADDFFTVNGLNGPSTPIASSYVNAIINNDFSTPGLVTRDASAMDLLVCDTGCSFGFAFDTSGLIIGQPFAVAAPGFSYDFEPLNASRWSISGGGAVPEPASWTLLIAGFGLTGAALRRRRVALAA